MDSSANRNILLGKLNSMQDKKRASSQNAAAKNRLHEKAIARNEGKTEEKLDASGGKPKVLIFGKQKLFFGTLKSSLASYCDVLPFDNIEKATEFILDNPLSAVVMDMDPPTDWRECHDLFTTGKMVHPNMAYIIYQSNKTPDTEVLVLEKKGAIVQQKPLNISVLVEEIKIASKMENK